MDVPFKQFGTQASWKDQWPPKSYNWKHQGWSQLEWWFHPQVRGAWGKVKAYKHPIGSIGVPQHFPSRAILVGSPATSSGRPGRQNISTGLTILTHQISVPMISCRCAENQNLQFQRPLNFDPRPLRQSWWILYIATHCVHLFLHSSHSPRVHTCNSWGTWSH